MEASAPGKAPLDEEVRAVALRFYTAIKERYDFITKDLDDVTNPRPQQKRRQESVSHGPDPSRRRGQ